MKSKHIIKDFILDKLHIFIMYFLNTALLIIFYNLYIAQNKVILYPIALSLFFFSIYLFIDFTRYYFFIKNLGKSIHCYKSYSREHRIIINKIQSIEESVILSNGSLEKKYKEEQRFMSQWIHNMKTPISVIQLSLQRDKNNHYAECNKTIKEEIERLYDMLNMALNYIRIEDFSKDFVLEEINILDNLKLAINNKKNLFIYNNCFPIIEVEEDVFKVYTDKKWNLFMIEQIISNAIKYSKTSESSKIIFRIKRYEDKITLSIKDEGIGIPKKDINRVFEPFFTGENGRLNKNSSGIGLYICKKIADYSGHNFTIYSEVENGTEVTITYLTEL